MSSEPAFVALGDIHLDHLIWRRHRDITGDATLGLQQALDHAIRLNVPLVLLGDIFDTSDPDPSLVQVFRQTVERATTHGIKVFAIQGNHDRRRTPWYQAISGDVINIGDGSPQVINGVPVVGFDFNHLEAIQESLADLSVRIMAMDPRPQILCLHQAVRQYLNIEGAWNCDLEWVPREIQMVIMGDIHKPLQLQFHQGAGTALYTGSGHARGIDEFEPRSVLVMNRDLSFTRAPIYQRPMDVLVVTQESDPAVTLATLDQFLQQAQAANAAAGAMALRPLLWVRFTEGATELLTRVQARLQGLPEDQRPIVVEDALVGKVTIEGQPIIDVSGMPSLSEILGTLVDRQADPEAFELASSLLAVKASKDVLPTIRSNYDRFVARRQGAL